jgi:photosystem II stability/assembly factor-like uncharacterized protein
MQRLNTVTRQRQTIKPGSSRPISCFESEIPAAGRVQPPYRWGWDTPILFSAVTPGVVYTAANVLFKSTDRGGSWTKISPDLTSRVNRDTVMILGRRLGAANYSPNGTNVTDPTVTATFGQITSIGESRLDPRVLYTGSEDGIVQVTRDGGATWKDLTKNIPSLPPFRVVSTVLPSQHVAGRVYATFDGHGLQDDNAYVYVSNDFGQTWRAITNGLPKAPVYRITEHPRDANLLAVGHARGVNFSNDGGMAWISLNTNMPTVSVNSVTFHARENSLIAGSYGRGIFILDDVGPLQRLTADGLKSDALLVSVTRGKQWNVFASLPTAGVGDYYAPNPEFDPTITYYVRDGADGSATITIRDGQGGLVRTLTGPAERGLNRVTWDMHMESALREGMVAAGGRGGRGGGGNPLLGPQVLPGTYTVAIRVPGVSRELRGDLSIAGDAMEKTTAAERRARFEALVDIHSLQKTLTAAWDANRATATSDSVTRVGQSEIERLIGVTASLMRSIENFSGPPTADQRQQLVWARDDVTRLVTVLNRAGRTRLAPPTPATRRP